MTTCPRAWEVEAARDGRLTGKARQTLEAHVETCASCARDAHALEELARGLRGLGSADVDDVSLRRLRNRVLDAVDAEQTGRVRSGERGARSRAAIAAVVLAAMVIGVVGFASWRTHGPRVEAVQSQAPEPLLLAAASTQPLPTSQASPTSQPSPASQPALASEETRVEVSTADGARYTRTTEAAVDRFELAEGTLRLRVQRPAGGRRVLVTVPDGEIEDVGTAFDVVVADRHTQRVSVHEGRVVVTLMDRAPVTVEAGKTWRRSPPKASASASASANAQVAGGEREDAAYLDVLRLMGEGRDGDARVAASRYLHDFPAGFRRAEMDRVANGQRSR